MIYERCTSLWEDNAIWNGPFHKSILLIPSCIQGYCELLNPIMFSSSIDKKKKGLCLEWGNDAVIEEQRLKLGLGGFHWHSHTAAKERKLAQTERTDNQHTLHPWCLFSASSINYNVCLIFCTSTSPNVLPELSLHPHNRFITAIPAISYSSVHHPTVSAWLSIWKNASRCFGAKCSGCCRWGLIINVTGMHCTDFFMLQTIAKGRGEKTILNIMEKFCVGTGSH